MAIAISGGGTGGHLIIAKNLAAHLAKQGIRAIFIGSNRGQDRAWFENSELFARTYFLQSSGVVDKKGFAKLASLLNILRLSLAARKILKQNGVRALISVGGYSSAPASIAAILSRVPFFIHEQNAVCGRLNRLLRPFARAFYSSYEKPAFAYPIADIFFETARQRTALKRVIFLGGSQGASFINLLAVELAPKLLSLGYGVIHQCGEREFERISQIYAQQGLDVQLVGFCKNMHELIASADLCVGRSGASTLWELCANGLPAIFVPFPFAAADHQFYNAKFLKERGLCEILRQQDASGERILGLIESFDVARASKGLLELTDRNGAQAIIDDVMSKI